MITTRVMPAALAATIRADCVLPPDVRRTLVYIQAPKPSPARSPITKFENMLIWYLSIFNFSGFGGFQYSNHMHYLRTFGRFILGSTLNGLLLLLPLLFALHALIATPAPLKHALQASGTYNSATNAILDQATKDNKDADPQTQKVLNTPDIRKIINDSFSPQFLQTNTEGALDNTYAWLNGKTDTLQISLDTASARTQLLAKLTTYATTRASSLPTCTPQQLRALDPNQDILSVPCLPKGVDAAAEATKFSQKVADSTGDLQKPQTQTIKTNEKSDNARLAFQSFNHNFWVLPLAAVLFGTAYVLLHRDRRSGIRRLSRLVLINGVTIGLLTIVFGILFNRTVSLVRESAVDNQAMQDSLIKVTTILENDFKRTLLIWSIGYIVVGVAALVVLHKYKAKPVVAQAVETPTEPEAKS